MDGILITDASLFISNKREIVDMVNKLKIPSIAMNEEMIDEGILFGTVLDYNAAGKAAADIININRIGTEMDHIPIKECIERTCINRSTLKSLSIKCDIKCDIYYDSNN
jgi:ABC-type uncharacterized transport system substrate-binding protein